MRLGLDQRLTQELRLTPQLILNLKLLQLTGLDLETVIERELEQNPALEQADVPAELPDAVGADPSVDVPVQADQAQAAGSEVEQNSAVVSDFDYTIADLMPNDDFGPMAVAVDDTDQDDTEVWCAGGGSPAEALMPRLRGMLSADDAELAEFVLQSLDEDGFLTLTEEEIATTRGVTVDRVQAVLYVIQRLEPGGLACRNCREALDVQLELAGYGPQSLERRLVGDLWGLLGRRQFARIAKVCGVEVEAVQQAVQSLGRFEPRPARAWSSARTSYVAPDYSVVWRDDKLVAEANDENFPRLRLSQRYRDILRNPDAFTREQVAFAREKFNRALMFLRAIESRRRTLRRLTELIIELQEDFFRRGAEHMRPATLREAAMRLGVHPSTLSRAIAGKYLETPLGIFPYKHFFAAGTGSTARTSIKEKIAQIIACESKTSPLSDDEIVGRLKLAGIAVSRRTVAKYRGEMGIPGCNERRML